MVECLLPKQVVAGPNPVTRSTPASDPFVDRPHRETGQSWSESVPATQAVAGGWVAAVVPKPAETSLSGLVRRSPFSVTGRG